jgi:cytosine/adenosine deaminase-related metal-dependent hydrolase
MRRLIEHLDVAFTVDKNDTILRDASVVIENDRIADIGSAADIAKRHKGSKFDETIDGRMKAICPGFIDSHVHLSETLSRAVFPDNLNTRAWVFHWAKPFYAHVTEEDEYWGAMLGMTEMLRGGTTCFLDMGSQYDPGIVVRAMEKTGMRGITGRHAADNPPAERPRGWTDEMMHHHFFPNAAAALEELEKCVRKYNGALGGRARCWVNIEGKEPCTLELHVGAVKLAQKLGVGTTYHLATSIEEAKVCEGKYGMWPVTRIDKADGLGNNLVIAHCAAVTDEEVQLLAKRGTKVAFCPCSSFKLGKGATAIGKYPEMAAAGVTVGLGTDGVSAAGNMNLMRQMLLVAGMFKDARLKPDVFTARQALRAATIEGAKAAMWDDEIGSLEVGKRADVVVLDMSNLCVTPLHAPVSSLVYSQRGDEVDQVYVDGRLVVDDGRLTTMDEDDIRIRSAAAVKRAGLHDDGVETTTTLYDEGN